MPILKLEMEEWSKGKKKVSTLQEEEIKAKESTGREGCDQAMMSDLDELEKESRRMEMKRKGDEQGRKPKRRKLDKMVGWGEAAELESIQQEGLEAWSNKVTTSTARVVQEVASESRLEQETLKMLMKETKIPEGRKNKEKT